MNAAALSPSANTDAQPSANKQANPMQMILLIVGVAIVVFLAFTAYSVQKSIQSSQELSAIKDLYFPVLERVDANIVRLDKIEEHIMQSVMLGDAEPLGPAQQFNAAADKAFVELEALYPARKAEIETLRADFKSYYELASNNSLGYIEKRISNMTEHAPRMIQALAKVREGIKRFRQSSYDQFVKTLVSTQDAAKQNLYLGIALGVMNLCFMGVLVFFIRNNVRMMAVIAEQNATLENRVAERTAQLTQKTNDINAMLQNMNLGVCTVTPGNRIHPEYSNYLRTIFLLNDLADKDVLEALFGNANLGVDAKDQLSVALSSIIGEDTMMFDCNGHLLPHEIHTEGADGSHKILQMDWNPIIGPSDAVEKVLLIVQDVTHLRELELASVHQKEELDMIAQIIKISIGKFNDFIDSSKKFTAENRQVIQTTENYNADAISILFRNMHTIKGNARTFEFKFITNEAHSAEQEYDQLRKDPAAPWDRAKLLADLDAVDAAIARYVDVNDDKLGRKGRASDLLTTRGTFVGHDTLTQLRALINKLAVADNQADLAQIQQTLHGIGLIPLQRLVSGAIDSLSSLAKELKKPTPQVELHGDIAVNSQFAEALKCSFMHMFRNSLDHGIESPAERERQHKPAAGQLRVSCTRDGDAVELQIGDDGRGLALHKLYEKGLAAGLFEAGSSPSASAVAESIFHAGLSTAEAVTQVSGRGVGMDAVRAFLREQGASIRVQLLEDNPPLHFAPFVFVISLPPSATQH